MANKIQIRRDTASNWTSSNPTLSQGEQGYETDTGKLKIGDGSTAWTSLGYTTYTHPNHSGEVTSTGDGTTVIADNVVDEANLKVSNAPTDGYFLQAQSGNTGGLTWAAASGGGGDPDLYRDNASSATTPSAAGTNAVAIGSGAVAATNESIALGLNATVGTSTRGTALGYSANATGSQATAISDSTASGGNSFAAVADATASATDSIALGRATTASSTYATAIGKNSSDQGSVATSGTAAMSLGGSYASGADSFAVGIANNTSSYGATLGNSIAIGKHAKSTDTGSVSIGSFSQAIASYAHSFGQGAKAWGVRSLALGYNAKANAADAVSIGYDIDNATANQVVLGGSTQQVKISDTYTLPTTDGSANQVLQTNGSGVLSFATVSGGGGADLYAANESSPTAQPSATGGNAVAIGEAPTASGNDSFAVQGGTASGNGALAIGRNVGGGNVSLSRANSTVAIMGSTTTNNHYSTAIGLNSSAHLATVGGSGMGAMALGGSYASGTDSFAAAITNNTSSYGATGANSIAIGQTSKATDSGSVAIGKSCISDGGRTVALGHQTTASSFYSFAVGALSEALETGSVTTGVRGRSNVQGKRVHSSSTFSAQIGNCQTGELVLGRETTDATSAQLTSIPGNSASTNNQVVLPNNSAFAFHGTVIARENSSQTDDFAVWEIKGGAVRGANAASTALGSYNINKISETTGAANWSIALSADTTNGAVAITVTGEASHSIRWVATVNTTEVTY